MMEKIARIGTFAQKYRYFCPKVSVLLRKGVLPAFVKHPVEVLLSVVFGLAGCLHFGSGSRYDFLVGPLSYFPVWFLVSYALNALTGEGASRGFARWRVLYYLSVFFFVSSLGMGAADIWSPTYAALLVATQLVCFACCRKIFALRYLKAALVAELIACAVYLSTVLVYVTLQHAFGIGEGYDRWFCVKTAYIVFMCGMPLMFLLFVRERAEGSCRLTEVLPHCVTVLVLPVCVAMLVTALLYAVPILMYVCCP